MQRKMQILFAIFVVTTGCQEVRYQAVPAYHTPYDSEWNRVKRCLAETAKLDYYRAPRTSVVWQLPTTTEQTGRGDCTALATVLYHRLLKSNVKDGRIVFGYYDGLWHAWVNWRGYILDPTMSPYPIKKDWGGYQPCWGYDMAGKYRYVATEVPS
ncbi:MAG: hypothetical protein GXP25_11840 [Planctomycetes bacterium]|nr:hypothetical protein [Planctomycetota bacterium]